MFRFLLAFIAVFPCAQATELEFQLVTNSEYEKALHAGENPLHDLVPKSLAAPSIQILSPVVTNDSLASPMDIEIRFEAADDASINMSSLKIYYLMFIKKDITDRLLEHAEIGDSSITANGAKLPAGKHKFLVEVHDSKNRKGKQIFAVKVRS